MNDPKEKSRSLERVIMKTHSAVLKLIPRKVNFSKKARNEGLFFKWCKS